MMKKNIRDAEFKSAAESVAKNAAKNIVENPDGRRTRGQANKRSIVVALSGLIREGVVAPTAEQVAAKAGVGLRSVFRHFDDMETLYREIANELDQLVQPSVQKRLKSKDWHSRLAESIELRALVFEGLMPFHIASEVHRQESPFLNAQQVKSASLQRELLRHLLPKELVLDKIRFEALNLVLSMDAWLRLRREQGLSKSAAKRVMQHAAAALTAG